MPGAVRLAAALGVGTGLLFAARPSAADEPSAVAWHDDWARFRPAEYVATGVLAVGSAVAALTIPQPSPSWTGGILFDDGVRDALRAQTRSGRERAATASDVLLYTGMALPVLGDAALSAWAAHGNSDTALQMALLEAESFSLSFALELATKRLAARERPLVHECARNPSYSPACNQKLDGSFYSGHTSTTFTAAGLVCENHMNLPLWGGGAADVAACIGALGLATTTGALRIVADRHYASDVVVGAGAGLASGLLVPWLLHYRGGHGTHVAVNPVVTQGYAGVSIVGMTE